MTVVAWSTRCWTCSGRTFDGPAPNRPSAGLRSVGISRTVVSGMGVSGSGADHGGVAQASGDHGPELMGAVVERPLGREVHAPVRQRQHVEVAAGADHGPVDARAL